MRQMKGRFARILNPSGRVERVEENKHSRTFTNANELSRLPLIEPTSVMTRSAAVVAMTVAMEDVQI